MLFARSAEECHLYMELHACSCGADTFMWSTHRQELRSGRRISAYEGTCPSCGTARTFEFEVAPVAPPPPAYGDETPSRIIDPGEFLSASHRAAAGVPPTPDRVAPEDLDVAYDAIDMAVAGVVEVLKFIPPGAATVPAEAFTSELGRRLHAADPGQFGRDRLELELADYERIRAAYAARLGV